MLRAVPAFTLLVLLLAPGVRADTCDGAPDEVACDDGDACTRIDTCVSGACIGTDPVPCAARDQCHTPGTCNPATGACSDPPAPDATPCNDTNACTRTDACVGGLCAGSNPVPCAARDQCHTPGTCDPATGACSDPLASDATPCNDANACTRTDACVGGACIGHDPVPCAARDQCHTPGTCDPATGACSDPAASDATPCNDGNVCTTADACRDSRCVGFSIAGCCMIDTDCDDRVACTDDHCVDNACVRVRLDDRCGPGPECARAVCAPEEGGSGFDGCVLRPTSEAAFCNEDGDPCTIDACHAGSCAHGAGSADPACYTLEGPFRRAVELLTRTDALRGIVSAAASKGCSTVGGMSDCELIGGPDGPAERLLSLLAAAEADLRTAVLALGGHLANSSAPDAAPSAKVRARFALTLLDQTPGSLLGFRATITQERRHHAVAAGFARARRNEIVAMLRAVNTLRMQLRRVIARRGSFIP
jgi:hypothetical protein